MIEGATAISPQNAARADADYKNWQSAGQRMVMRHDLNERTAGPMPSFGNMVHHTALAAQGMNYAPSSSAAADGTRPDIDYAQENKESFGFDDIIDIINPLQHLPVIGALYRKITGDTIGSFSSIVGGALFGGPIGAVGSTINVAIKESTGKDIAENALSVVGFGGAAPEKPKLEITDVLNSYAGKTASDKTSVVVANLYAQTASGQKNFAGKTASSYSWNT